MTPVTKSPSFHKLFGTFLDTVSFFTDMMNYKMSWRNPDYQAHAVHIVLLRYFINACLTWINKVSCKCLQIFSLALRAGSQINSKQSRRGGIGAKIFYDKNHIYNFYNYMASLFACVHNDTKLNLTGLKICF